MTNNEFIPLPYFKDAVHGHSVLLQISLNATTAATMKLISTPKHDIIKKSINSKNEQDYISAQLTKWNCWPNICLGLWPDYSPYILPPGHILALTFPYCRDFLCMCQNWSRCGNKSESCCTCLDRRLCTLAQRETITQPKHEPDLFYSLN